MKKISIYIILIFSFAFSNEVKIKDFDFCENNTKPTYSKINKATINNTKYFEYRNKKFKDVKDKKKFEELSKNVAFSYGEGNDDYFVFLDPECRFSRAFAKGTMDKLNGAKYHIILLPLNKHKESKKMISFILNGKSNMKRFERYKSVMIDDNFKSNFFLKPKKEELDFIDNSIKVSKDINLTSTPTFFKIKTKNCKRISWQEYNEHMDKVDIDF